ncbi:MAG: hypothetical protein AB8B83_02515 [Bdellovibrionales bacterium]
MRADLKDKLRTESNLKFIVAALFVIIGIGVMIFEPRGKEFQMTSAKEVKIAMQICQNAKGWVEANRSKLKLGSASRLDHILVNGQKPNMEYVKTPQVIFISSGFNSPNMTNNMFCEVINPATNEKIYFDFEKRVWRDNVRFRR